MDSPERLARGRKNSFPLADTLAVNLGDIIGTAAKQLKAHLLCGECEDRFNRNGEGYALTQVHAANRFPLLDRLNVAMPLQAIPELALYSG